MDQFLVESEIYHTVGNLLLWVIFLILPFFFSIETELKMNTRSQVQALTGAILEYFQQGKAPTWKEIQPAFVEHNIVKFLGIEKFSTDFLKVLFKNSEHLIERLEFFKDHHHYITMLLMKEEYCMLNCDHCGYIVKKIEIISENEKISQNYWQY